MRLKHLASLVILFGILLRPAIAAEPLEDLVNTGQYQQAYELAASQLGERAGDPRFDFLYGMAAIETARPQEAVFAFERVLGNIPEDHRSRLELARAHFMLANYELAEELFKEVLESDPPLRVRKNVESFLEKIALQTKARDSQISSYASIKAGGDSNINSATIDTAVVYPSGLTFTLDENSRELSDGFAEIGVGANYIKLLRKDMGYFLSLSLSDRHNSTYSQFDLRSTSFSIGHVQKSEKYSLRVPIQMQLLEVARDRYRTSVGTGFEWGYMLSNSQQLALFTQWAQQRYTEVSNRWQNTDLKLGGLAWTLEVPAIRSSFSISAYTASQPSVETGDTHAGKQFSGFQLSGQWQPRPQHKFQFSGVVQTSTHDDTHPSFDVIRKEDFAQLSLSWAWDFRPQWRFEVEQINTANNSSISIYSYDRSQSSLMLRHNF